MTPEQLQELVNWLNREQARLFGKSDTYYLAKYDAYGNVLRYIEKLIGRTL
jgi:hypothetical protein